MPAVTYQKALDVIKLISDGETVLKACDALYITPIQFKATCKREPALAQMLAEAEEIRDDILADILADLQKLPSDPKMASVYSSNVRFLLERRRPLKYGKVAEASNPDSEANRLLAQALAAAVDRIPQTKPAVATITDATFTVVEPKKEAPRQAAPEVSNPMPSREASDGMAELKRLGLI